MKRFLVFGAALALLVLAPRASAATLPGCGMAQPCTFTVADAGIVNTGTNSAELAIESAQSPNEKYDFLVSHMAGNGAGWVTLRHQADHKHGLTLKFTTNGYLYVYLPTSLTSGNVLMAKVPVTIPQRDPGEHLRVMVAGYTYSIYDMTSGHGVLLATVTDAVQFSSWVGADIAVYVAAQSAWCFDDVSGRVLP